MQQLCCIQCGGPLMPSQIKPGRSMRVSCFFCLYKRRIAFCLGDAYLNEVFAQPWTRALYQKLGLFLQEHGASLQSQSILLTKAAGIFQQAERSFTSPEEISAFWIENRIEEAGATFTPSLFRAFLQQERLLSPISRDEKALKQLLTRIELLPREYRHLVEMYLQERIALREWQRKQRAKNPLSVATLSNDITLLSRLIRWLQEHQPDLTGWEMVQEEHVNTFLLTLTPKHREVTRGKLYQVFRFGRKRKILAHVPLTKFPPSRLSRTTEPLTLLQQKAVAHLIHEAGSWHPEEALLTALCFYHGLRSSQICQLRTDQVDVERSWICFPEQPPIYLLSEDLLLLEKFLNIRKDLPHAKDKKYLFITHTPRIEDKPLKRSYVADKVQAFCGYSPRCLRISCFTTLASYYGPHYLVEAFGLSPAQAVQYADWREHLVEEEVKQQRAVFIQKSRS